MSGFGGPVGRILRGVLIFQLGIAALLAVGDVQGGGGLRLPAFAPQVPRLSEPVRPGDQRRVYRPGRDRPATAPSRRDGPLPGRLVLTRVEGETWRLAGTIDEDDAQRIIGQMQENLPVRVLIDSPGGSVTEALELGRFLRKAGIVTVIEDGAICYSACPYLLAGGSDREIAPDASVGVHQHYFGQSSILPAAFAVEDIQYGQGEVMAYLDEMGIDPLVMRHALTTPPDEIYILLRDELERYGFVPGG